MPTRDDAWKLLCEYTESESLRKHMLAVETCVRAYAKKIRRRRRNSGASQRCSTISTTNAGPTTNTPPTKAIRPKAQKFCATSAIPKKQCAQFSRTPITPELTAHTPLEHTIFACDELAGFLTACAYVRPSKSILDLEVDSVKRRLKDKAFAKGVSREDVRLGAEELKVPLEEHIQFCINAMRENADALGLRGNL